MPINSKVKKLYDALKADGGDVGTPEEFNSWFFKPGKEGYKNRKSVYDTFKADGADVGKNYEEFGKWLGIHAVYPTVNKYHQQMLNSVDPNKSRASELTRKAVGQAVRATNNVRKPVVAKVVNRKGKPTGEKFAITPAKTVEDLDREYAQETTKNWENELHDQMADADKDAAKISDMFKSFIGSTDEVGSVWGNMTRGGGIAGTPHSVTTNNGILENAEARQILAAGEYNRKRRELLQLEKDSRNGVIFDDHSFWRGMYDAAKDTGFLTGGASDLINSGSLLATKQDLDNGVHTEAGDMLLQQAVKNSDAQSQYGDNQGWMYTGGIITTNMAPFITQIASAGFSEGMSTSIGKVVQSAASKVALGTMEKATGMAGAHIANYIGKVTGLTTKAFGKAIQYGIVGAAQANTVGLGNVANDVVNRYTGQVYQDEQGNYKFGTFDSDGKLVHEGGEDFLTSLVKGEAAQTIEFATELAGGGIDAVGTALKNFVTKGGKKIINKYNMENVSKVIDFLLNNKVSKNARYLKAGADRTLGKVELNSIVGESLEEELGIIANTVFTGDNKISDLWDEKQQSQIWGGMLLSIGLMKGAVAPFHAYNAKQYYSYKHKLNKADVNLSQLLGKEKWDELRNKIDATTNKDMPEMINKINRDVALGKNRQPVREYIQNLLIMRGYDIGNMLAAKKAVEDRGKGVSVKNMEKNQAYQQGRDAYGYDTHEIQLDQADKQKTLAQLLGITEQQLSTMSDEELDNLSGRDDNLDKAIYDYQLSTIRYQGVADNAQDQVDLAAQKAAQAVDMYTDKSRNTIRNATIKATGGLEDYGVYIINGNIATHDDGSIDVGNSDDMILFYDPTTNTVEHADATRFAELGSEENADEVRNQAVADAKENAIKEITGIIDGVVEVGTQFKTIDADGTEHTYDVLADNGDGTAIITIDGNIPTQLVKGENVQVPVSFEELQKMKDASDQQRLQAAKAQREQMEKERAEQQKQAQTAQVENPAQHNNSQPAPIEDNLDYSEIIQQNGKVNMVDVSDKEGNNMFPDAKDVFLIQGNKTRTKFAYIDPNGEVKVQSFPTSLVKVKSKGEVSVDEYKKYRQDLLAAESPAMDETSMIEENSGAIEGDRGGIEVNDELPPVPDNVTINGDGTYSVDGAVQGGENNAAPAEQTEQTPAMTLEDGTIVPMLEDGNPDFSKLTADQTAELYDSQFGDDADSVISGWVSDAKKALDKANNMTVKGKNFVEQKAAKEAKEKAIADAQDAYDSAIAIRDAYNNRQLAKVEDDADGRKNLIEKARRKYNRLKSAVKDDAEAVSQLYKDVVGSLLHRLYDSTGIDVTDTIPLTAEEYVASNLGAHSLNYEGTETSKGVKQETGLSREDFAKTQLLAADGKGTTIDDLVHSLWENRPSNLESLNTQDIRNALIDVLTSGFKASEARNYVENLRIAQAENFLEEQKKAADNAAFAEEQTTPAEQQTETAPESDEQTGEENSDEINDEEDEKINEQTNENINAPEVPEDATDENPLGLQLSEDKVPFLIDGEKSGTTYDINDKEDRQRLVAENSVDDKDILDIDMPEHVHKAIKELCKKMGLKVQFLYMGARLNGWVENGTMYLALDTEKATQFVFGHEMTHAIKQKNPEAYKELVKVAMAVTTKKKFEEDLAKVYRIYHNASGYNNIDDFVEEVIADNIGKFINDYDFAQKIALRLNHPVLATILHAIQKIKGLLYGDPYKSVDALERIVEKAYVDTANGEITNSETGEDVSFSLRQKPEPKKKGIGYKVFVLKDGKLYPPMVANPDGAATPVGVWLDADAAPIAGESKTGRPQVKQGGKGTQGGSGKLAYRPGWHLGVVPYAIQFNRKDAEGNKTLFPKNFVFAEVEYAADVDYQEEARQEGINPSGKYQHSLAGLKHLPTDGYYMYRTNPNPETDPWVITGAMKVNRILTRAEQADLVSKAGREPQQIQEGDIVTDDVVNSINQEIADAPKFSLKVYHGSGADFTEFDFEHMGEGAGSQAFGWGGYVTSSKKIGKSYAEVGQQSAESRHAHSEDTPIEAAVGSILGQEMYNHQAKTFEQKKAQAIKNAENSIASYSDMLKNSNELDEKGKKFLQKSIEKDKKELEVLRTLTEEQYKEEYIKQGRAKNLYEVDIPEDNGNNYIEFYEDATPEFKEQIKSVLANGLPSELKEMPEYKEAERNFYEENGTDESFEKSLIDDALFELERRKSNGDAYNALSVAVGDKLASKILSSLGYTGIKYPAGTIMGGAEEGDTNYVIFKPEDMKITEHTKFSLKDNQGNPLNQDGTLKLDKIKSVDELTDEDFLHPTRNVELPSLPKKIADAIGTEGKPVVIKKNIFERNYMRHKDVTPELSKVIFKSALYNPDLYGQNQKKTRPYNWVLINTKDEKGNNRTVLLEVNPNKDNVEIVHWHFVNDKNLGLIKKQAIREGDQVLILPSEQSEEVGGLSNLTDDLSAAKIDNSSETAKENGEKVDSEGTKFSLKDEKTMFGMHNISIDKLRKAIKQGGFAAPSMGVVDSKNGIYSDYGEITLIPKAEKLAKRTGKNAGTFTADAWTPTYPQVERIMNKQGEKAFNTDMNEKLGDVDNGIYSNIRESWKGYLSSGDVRDGLYWHYLFDKGMNPETIYHTGKYDNDITNEVMRISDNGYKTDYTDKEVAELIQLMNKATGKDNDVDAQREKLKARIASAEKQGNHLLVALKKKRLAELEGIENFFIAADFVNDVVRNNRKNGKVDVHDTMGAAKKKVEDNKKLSTDFPSWLDKKTEEYGVEEMLYNGTTPSGKPKYIPNTIDNAVKLMKKQGVAGGYTAFGSELGVFIAKNSPEVNTLAAMKNAKDKLIPFGDERHNQIKDKITKEFLELSDEIRVGSNNRYAFDDSGVSRMVELTDHKGNEKEYLKKAYNVEVSDEWMDRYNKLLDTIKKDYKVFYFETKFMRPYGLDEFEKAIVPSDTPSDVVDALKKAGIDVSSYERGNAEDRQKVTMDAINSSDNIRFSLKEEKEKIIADAKANGTYMTAPNGEKTKLDAEQWATVRTANFKNWFGDWENDPENASKVVDENGEPLVVYHGTTNDETKSVWNEKTKSYDTYHEPFTVFKREVDGLPNSGLFFNSSEDNAYEYGYNNYAVYLSAKNPLVIDCKGSLYNSIKHDGKTMDTYDWANWAEENGYDGVIFKNIKDGVDYGSMQNTTDDYVAFNSNQIKSAENNNGDFSSGNNDIRFSLKSMMTKPEGWKQANKKAIHIAEAIERDPKFSLKNLDGTLIKAGTYFSGGGLVEEGLKGIIDPVVAVEYDEKISGVYRNNFGQHIVTADVRDVDPKELVKQIDGEVEYFHASPVCKNYSQAKSNHTEVELDKETAASTAEFINAVKPKVVTIENVKGYKDSEAMKIITDALGANGYTWDADVYNAADYGGYTNRERLIVRAVRDGKLPAKPEKMSRKSGWYEAVEDIIPTLTEKKNGVAPWMDIRLKADGIDWRNIDKPLYVMGSAYADGKIPHAFADELLPTLRTKSGDVIVMPDGKVYRAMGRVLARVSGVSDDYKMPFSENLSHTIIGNGIPTQLTEHVIAPLLTGSDPKFSIRTYHGTGASFDKFDLSHALEGEGSESFGHGVYVTNSSKIGREYAQRAKNRKMEDLYKNMRYPDGVKGDIFKRRVFGEMVNDVATGGSVASAKEFAKKRVGADANDIQRTLENLKDREKGTEYEQNLKNRLAEYKEGLKWIDSLDEDYLTQGNANRYDVDIPDDNGSNYLDWEGTIPDSLDKQKVAEDAYKVVSDNQGFNDFKATPLNDFIAHTLKTYVNTTDVAGRVEKLKSDIKDVIENYVADDDVLALNEYLKYATPDDVLATIWYNDLVRDIKDADLGEELYRKLSTYVGDNAASQILSDNGLVGIKYPAGLIHGGAKEGDYNYVIFDENNANIVGNTRFSLRYDKFEHDLNQWKKDNNLPKDAAPMEKPIKQDDENIFDYMNRMVEWTRNQNLWKTAPKQTGFQDALDKWKADNGLSPDAYPPVRPHRENYSTEIGYAEDLEEYNKKKELWKSAPKPKDFDLPVDLEDMNKQLRNIRRAVLNQKNYDQRTVKAVSDLVRKMLNIGWGDGLSRGKVGNLLSAAKNATGANDVKKYLDKAMGILADNYLNRLSTSYDNLINTKGARADQSGVIKMGSLDAKGQAFMSEYKKAINMDDKSLNTYIANIEEDSAKNEGNVEMNDYRLAGIQAAIMFKQQIGGNDADIAELQRQIGELKNKKDATKEDKDLLKSLEKKLFENKFDRITMYENLLNNIQRMVKESKGRAKEFREELAEHKNEILHRANLDLEGVDSTYYDTTTAKKKLVNNDLQRAVFSSTYTFEQFLKFFGKKAANGEGYLYNYFTKLNQDALDEEQLYNEMNRNALDEKTKELFGKKRFMKLVGIDGKGMKEMDIEVTDYSNKKTGKRTIHLKQGQMLYIYLVNKETDGEMKLRAMGITEEDVAAIEENLDPRVKAMGEWLQDEYLPECQRRYQATHTKYFGAPMKEVENYFPLAINNRARNVKEDVNQDSDAMSQLAGTSTGAIVTRRVNVIPLDIENADAFEVAFNHLQEMEEWSAMLPFRQDVNTLLSYTHFRNQVQNMSSVAYGSGKTLWDEFKQTAQIAAGTYKPKVNAGMMDSRIAAAMGGIAVAKISGRLWTAIKQSQSATVFLPECDFTRFVKNGVNPYGSWKWAMENIPDFRKRVENMTYGDVKLRQYLDELEKWHDWTKTISKIRMAPNILVDGITCAVGARSVYETEVNRMTKLGYPKEKAEEKAYYKSVAAYNKTQQSSGGMYLSPMQVDRTYVSAALSLFKNANFAYGRMQIEACRGLARTYDLWGGKHKTALIESMTRQIMEEDGLDENAARAIAKATYNRTFRQSIGRLINFATLVPISWALYKVLPYLLTGDDDDKKTDMIEEGVLKGFATSLSDNYVIPFASNILNAGLKVEDGKPTFDPEVFRYQNLYINPATSDLANIYSMIGNQKWYSVANKLGMLGVQSLIGFNPETVGALYQAFAEADYDNGNTAKEWQIGILKAISAPEESIRELYMDELGLKSGDKDAMKKFMSLAGLDADDIKKVPLSELEKRYAERQINRDNLLSQIGMDAETFNGYVDKYQKSFEKKIKDKMDKWDEYDKKKIDEFFDTTSDPKLKDMIAKKRAKDANAAADEQIAKEGLNQEKKGKEPSEEAYDAVKMSIDVAEDNVISTYNKVLNKRYAALNDEYNNQTDAMKYIFMSNHPNFKAYKDIESEYTNYGKKMKELKEKLVSADGYDAKQTILKQIRAERDKFYELQSKVR